MSNITLKILKNDGEVLYKADSFWSLFKDHKDAKLHSSDSLERLSKNLISNVNYMYNEEYDEENKVNIIKKWNGRKIGYDYVNRTDNSHSFEFSREGQYVYRIDFDKYSNEFLMIDISRAEKLKKLELLNEN